MAVLTPAQRAALAAQANREFPGETSLLKPQLRAALDALDDWFDANMAAMNAAIPQPQRTVLTAQQKAFLFMLVVQKRFG